MGPRKGSYHKTYLDEILTVVIVAEKTELNPNWYVRSKEILVNAKLFNFSVFDDMHRIAASNSL